MHCDDVSFVSAGKFSTSDPAWMHPVRRSAYTELLLVTDGEMTLCENYNEFVLTAGSVLFLRAGEKHYGSRPSACGVTVWRISFKEEKDGEPLPFDRLLTMNDYTRAAQLCEQISHDSLTPEYPAEVCDALLRLLLIELLVYGSGGGKEGLPAAICAYVRGTGGQIRVRDVAEHFDYNEDYITRVFKRIYAKGIKAYIDAVRLARIRQCLADDSLSIAAVAAATGFEDAQALGSFFRYRTGMSPAAYRGLYTGVGS